MTLGTAWAVRGQFGHEQGAAWAGALGALCIILLSQRGDWHAKVFKVALAAAVGWGLGGMMSYGIVVGYGHGVDFINVYYGLTMLFVIGGLYGFIGGGMFGLALDSSKENPVLWLDLVTKMVVGGIIVYFFIIYQLEWFMTPPRSELWAACLGMALALTWHMIHEHRESALRVAIFSGLGAGFGFAFGNFLQVMGKQTEVAFNFWNVMEYSLGFFGGLGMAYGTFTSKWPRSTISNHWGSHLWTFLMLVLVIPLVIWKESFTTRKLLETADRIGIEYSAFSIQVGLLFSIVLIATVGAWLFFYRRNQQENPFDGRDNSRFFKTYFLAYILLSLILTGAFFSTYRIEQYLYLVNYIFIQILLPRAVPQFYSRPTSPALWGKLIFGILISLAILTLMSTNSHEAFEGMHRRFIP